MNVTIGKLMMMRDDSKVYFATENVVTDEKSCLFRNY